MKMHFSISIIKMFTSIWANRSLIKTLVVREVVGRYRGSVLGILWSFFNPIFMLIVYTFVFGIIFKSRWNANSSSTAEFALILFSGLLTFNIFSECINRAPLLILGNVNFVKKVVFPLEVLPVVAICSALFHAVISLIVWLIFYLLIYGTPHLTILLFPVILLPLVFLTLGISWFLASIGTYLRDVGQVVGVVVMALLFVSPVFYPLSSIPKKYQSVMMLNPLAIITEGVHGVLFWGETPNWKLYGLLGLVSIVVAWIGFAWFQATRKGFADVL